MIKWPGNSPDLDRIENLSTLIKMKVSTSNPTTLDELNQTIKEIWCKDIDQNVCKNLTISIPSTFRKFIKTRVTTPILVELLTFEPCWRCLDCLVFVSSFVTFNNRKNIKVCHRCVFSAFKKTFLNFFPERYIAVIFQC